ncbi:MULTISPECIES: alkaline phosphatase [Shewanella]|uniref:Alkaline phosphatase n=2 Tax=Shewanella indica TaxID=768528 RepID=A0ABU4QCH0_9GAMM|nr:MULTISPECIES: alkaline phosphatase [Shewanella]MDX6016738.1 alkaline phosphatase [Shewanella indica]TVP13501.1 alkaline phosphatase [Shewanella sp. MSW]
MKLSQLTGALLGLSLLLPLAVDANQLPNPAPSRPQNIVIMVGDGMGPAYTSAYRYFKDNPDTEEIEQTVFDRLLVGMASTYPARVSGYVTDSAAAATALATGVKSYNGAISVDTQKQPIPTIMEKAKQRGMSTGVAVTSQINHATPAAFLSHSESRKHYVELANKYLETDADVMLGGGQKYFDQELLAKFDAKGYQILQEFSALESITQPKVMGLFAEVQLPWVLDDKDGHRLSTMTGKALELLSQNNNGFVLLVEGSLIDWAGHNNDIAAAMAEMDEFARTMEVVEQFVRQNPNTLMVATADHNTGGLSIGSKGKYAWNPEVLKGLSASIDTLAAAALTAEDWQAPLAQGLGFELEPALLEQLAKARMQGKETLASAIKQEVDRRSNTGWTTGGHTGTDVQVFAAGPGAELFIGNQDNTDIASKLSSLLPKGQHAAK